MLTKVEETLPAFIALLETHSIPYALIGGMAVGYWSEERFTKDVDLTIALNRETWRKLQALLNNDPEFKVDKICTDSGEVLPYLVRLGYRGCDIDLIVSLTEFQEELLSRSVSIDLYNAKIRIASPEDIIVCKLIAARSQDLVDIEKMIQFLSDLDFSYIEKWAKVWEIEDRLKVIHPE